MSTTNLFMELVVIGIFAAAWVAMALFAWSGIPDVAWGQIPAVIAAVPALAVVYVLGIITDRLADWLFDKLFYASILSRFELTTNDVIWANLLILRGADRIAELGEYARSRARICRGVAFNSALLVLAVNAFSVASDTAISSEVNSGASLALIFVGIGAWYAWRSITIAGLEKLEAQAKVAARGR